MYKQIFAAFLASTVLFGSSPAFALDGGGARACLGVGATATVLGAIGIVINGVLLAHYRGSEFVNGLSCSDDSKPKCCPSGATNASSCTTPVPASPFNCSQNTTGKCEWITGVLVGPSTSYTPTASSAQLATGIMLGLSCITIIFVPLTMVGVWTQCT